MEEEKYTHKCPVDGAMHMHGGKCPDHPDVDLVPIEEEMEKEEMDDEEMMEG